MNIRLFTSRVIPSDATLNLLSLIVCCIWAVLWIFIAYPSHVWDDPSMSYGYAIEGIYHNWHPPLFTWILRQFHELGIFPFTPITIFGSILLAGSTWWISHTLQKTTRYACLFVLILPLLSITWSLGQRELLYIAFIMLGLGSLLTLPYSRRKYPILQLGLLALSCFFIASLRHVGIAIVLGYALSALYLLRPKTSVLSIKTILYAGLGTLAIHLLSQPILNTLLDVRNDYPTAPQMVRDIAAMDRMHGHRENDLMQRLAPHDPASVKGYIQALRTEYDNGTFICKPDDLTFKATTQFPLTEAQSAQLSGIWKDRISNDPGTFIVVRGLFIFQQLTQCPFVPGFIIPVLDQFYPNHHIVNQPPFIPLSTLPYVAALLLAAYTLFRSIFRTSALTGKTKTAWILALLAASAITPYLIIPNAVGWRYMGPALIYLYLFTIVRYTPESLETSDRPALRRWPLILTASLAVLCIAAIPLHAHYYARVPSQGQMHISPFALLSLQNGKLVIHDAPTGRFGHDYLIDTALPPEGAKTYSTYILETYRGPNRISEYHLSHRNGYNPLPVEIPFTFPCRNYLCLTSAWKLENDRTDTAIIKRYSQHLKPAGLFRYEPSIIVEYDWISPQEQNRQLDLPISGNTRLHRIRTLQHPGNPDMHLVRLELKADTGDLGPAADYTYRFTGQDASNRPFAITLQRAIHNDPSLIGNVKPGHLPLSGQFTATSPCTLLSIEVRDTNGNTVTTLRLQ